MQRKVWVASGNPVKINAAKEAFKKVFPEVTFEFESKAVPSGIPDQPIGVDVTLLGASNRVKNLRKKGLTGDFFVGMEGGIQYIGDDCFAFAWMLVESKNGNRGKAQTAHFQLPRPVVDLLKEGYELGIADDMVFGTSNSKQKSGAVGIFTKGLIDRKNYYEHALILALIPFNKDNKFE